MIRATRRRKATDRGAAMVEFAIMLPLLLLVIAGIVDLGRAFFTQVTLTNAAREGARYAVVKSDATVADVQARTLTAAPGLNPALTAAVTLCAGAGTDAKVIASQAFTWIALGPAMNLVGGASALPPTLSSTAVMRCGG
jgi:Flp pilus assembly protein TadG